MDKTDRAVLKTIDFAMKSLLSPNFSASAKGVMARGIAA